MREPQEAPMEMRIEAKKRMSSRLTGGLRDDQAEPFADGLGALGVALLFELAEEVEQVLGFDVEGGRALDGSEEERAQVGE